MILTILTFYIARLGLSNLFNFIFIHWSKGFTTIFFISLIIVIFAYCNKQVTVIAFPIVAALWVIMSILVYFRNFTPFILAIILSLSVLFLIMLIAMRLDISTRKKLLILLL